MSAALYSIANVGVGALLRYTGEAGLLTFVGLLIALVLVQAANDV